MPRYAAFLRAVNLGSHKKVAMTDLRATAEALGFHRPQTLLQTGNLVFDSPLASAARAESRLEQGLAAELGLETECYVRTPGELDAIVAANPYPGMARDDPAHLVVMLFRARLAPSAVKALAGAIRGRETVAAEGRTLYLTYPDGIGTSKLTPAVIARHLGVPGTGRNWNTLLKVQAAATAD
ncbi:MAG: DUF1697 domain-containing protein [Gemmatimonadales bacterium]